MEYFKLLHLTKEPFSNSPDPAFFYASGQHKDCIQKLEIAMRLRRGLNVVIGEVGTGKTTLCRQLIQTFSEDPRITACLVLDPDFPDPRAFLGAVVHMMTACRPAADDTISAMKENLKHYLFEKGVEEDRTVVLIIDEGQKIPPACLETLRELLNFETNEYKLLQIVIFAQNEFADTLNTLPNLADRINLYYRLKPLPFKEVRALIRHRLQSAANPENAVPRLFSIPALWRIYRSSGGYPRKIIHLCHQCLLTTIIQNKTAAGWRIAGACARRTFAGPRVFRWMPMAMMLLILAVIGLEARQYFRGPEHALLTVQNRTENSVLAAPPPNPTSSETTITPSTPDAVEPAPSSGEIAPDAKNQTPAIPSSPEVSGTKMGQETDSFDALIGGDTIPGDAPSLLGRVPVMVGDTLGELVKRVYGAYTYRYHQAVVTANPQLTDPNSLRVGQSLNFPALAADMGEMPATTWWVSLFLEPNLEAAMAKLREEETGDLPLRLLVTRNPEEGLFFRIVLKTCFETEPMAELAREHLTPSESTIPKIFCLEKNEGIVYGTPGI